MNNNFRSVMLFLSCFIVFAVFKRMQCLEDAEKTSVNFQIQRSKKSICPDNNAVLNIDEQVQELIKVRDSLNALLTRLKGKNCADFYAKGTRVSGVYKIDPDGKGSFNVFCDMKTSGGGWTVFQRRLDGSVDFFRGWKDYKDGFGDLKGEFWLGLDKIHRLSVASRNELRIDMEDTSGNTRYAEYDLFAITSERVKYQLSLGKYHGTAGDSFSYHKGMAFSTKDSDNDKYSLNCAVMYKGSWWYNKCHSSNLNGFYHHGSHKSYADGITWNVWKGYNYSLKSSSMKIRPRLAARKKTKAI